MFKVFWKCCSVRKPANKSKWVAGTPSCVGRHLVTLHFNLSSKTPYSRSCPSVAYKNSKTSLFAFPVKANQSGGAMGRDNRSLFPSRFPWREKEKFASTRTPHHWGWEQSRNESFPTLLTITSLLQEQQENTGSFKIQWKFLVWKQDHTVIWYKCNKFS